jgi:hypothetical protein
MMNMDELMGLEKAHGSVAAVEKACEVFADRDHELDGEDAALLLEIIAKEDRLCEMLRQVEWSDRQRTPAQEKVIEKVRRMLWGN